jgi:pimeloyl-ACP methyl ester carboxylesterase
MIEKNCSSVRVTFIIMALLMLTFTGCRDMEKSAIGIIEAEGFRVDGIDSGEGSIGINEFRFRLTNASNDNGFFSINLKTDGSRGWGKSYYYEIPQGESKVISADYKVPDRSFRVLRVRFGIPSATPSEDVKYPKAEVIKTIRLSLKYTKKLRECVNEHFRYWFLDQPVDSLKKKMSVMAQKKDPYTEAKKEELRKLLRWDRTVDEDFEPEVIRGETIGTYSISTMRIHGEPDVPIDFLIMRKSGDNKSRRTVLFLTPNPPGIKEIGIAPMMNLVDAGYQAVSMDRRPSARSTDSGEFLKNVADPIFDARRLADYLLTREDVASGGIAVVGFSGGAEEGQYLAVLHDPVCAAVLVSRPIEHEYLFNSWAWFPTLYDPDILRDIGMGSLLDKDFWTQFEALTPKRNKRAFQAFRKRYPFFDLLNSTHVLPLAAPKPILVITGAQDEQFPVDGVLALDRVMNERYETLGVEDASVLFIMPRRGHEYAPEAMDLTIDFLRLWM